MVCTSGQALRASDPILWQGHKLSLLQRVLQPEMHPNWAVLPGHHQWQLQKEQKQENLFAPFEQTGQIAGDCWWPVPLSCFIRSGAVRNHVPSTRCGTGTCKELCSSWRRLALALRGTDEARWGKAWGPPFHRWHNPFLIQSPSTVSAQHSWCGQMF